MIILGALLSRLHGSTWLPYKVVKSLMWATPFALVASLFVGWWSFAVLAGCAAGKSMGHGRGLSLDKPYMIGKPERIETLISWLYPNVLSPYWYKAAILAATGFVSTLPFTVAMLFVNPLYALISAVGGLLKPLSYMIGMKLLPKYFTVVGEFLSGALAYIVLDLIIISTFLGNTHY